MYMKLAGLLIKSLRYYRLTNLSVAAAVAVCTAALTGALIVGDSVSYSLLKKTRDRLGGTELAMVRQEGFFTQELVKGLSRELKADVAGVLYLKGSVSTGDEKRIVNQVNIYGVDAGFYELMNAERSQPGSGGSGAFINDAVAGRLGVSAGEEIIVTTARPGTMPAGAALSNREDRTLSLRIEVGQVVSRSQFGAFGLNAGQSQVMNVFVGLEELQETLGIAGKVNMCLVGTGPGNYADNVDKADRAVRQRFTVEDIGVDIKKAGDEFRITAESVFINESLAETVMSMSREPVGILTYFVNSISHGGRSTPYSMVSAVSGVGDFADIAPGDGADDGQLAGITLTDWTAEDIDARPGDTVVLEYFVLTDSFELVEKQASFEVVNVIPLDTPGVDGSLMPDFPGLKDAENCSDWSSPVPIDFDRIREEDEAYWDKYRGTPKAFVNLETGQKLWGGRYGTLTEVRLAADGRTEAQLAGSLTGSVNPANLGMFFADVRRPAVKAAEGSTDFGQLFLGLSMFLIFSAVILIGLTFALGIENRTDQIGLLKAAGVRFGLIRGLFLLEGLIVALAGAVVGTAGGIAYTKVLIWALGTGWSGAVAGAELYFHANAGSLLIGAVSAVVISLLVIWLSARSVLKNSAVSLMRGNVQWQFFSQGKGKSSGLFSRVVYITGFASAVGLVYMGLTKSDFATGAFFGAGGLLLVGLIFLTLDMLRTVITSQRFELKSKAGLAVKNSAVKVGRSLAVITLIACGTFMITAVGVNGNMGVKNPRARQSGTGGFELYARATVGIVEDLNTEKGRDVYGIAPGGDVEVSFVNCRLHEGDEASCLNLNRPQKPTIMGVDHERLAELGAFSFNKIANELDAGSSPWMLLENETGQGVDIVPVIADYATVKWSLGKSVGDYVDYRNQFGEPIKLLIAGTVTGTMLQGSLMMSNEAFVRHFPDDEAYRVFLVDVEPANDENIKKVSGMLSSRLRDHGFEAVRTWQRLAMFNSVQNTYISIFQLLGGLGLILGTAGLGFIVVRNVLGRMGELAMIWAVGYTRADIRKMVFYEHIMLLVYGASAGVVAAFTAAWPVVSAGGSEVPYLSISVTTAGIIISGVVWTWIASQLALQKDLLGALRNE